MLELEHGKKLVKLARSAVEKTIKEGNLSIERIANEALSEKTGVFVTILTFPERSLRGCVGFPRGDLPLCEAVQKAAFASAFEDGRFPKIEKEELKKVIFEVSILTKPESIQVKDPREYAKKIEVGKDGLILQNGPFYGLLLPQVWELIPTAEEFLQHLCYKAGLTSDWIYDENTRIFKFKVQAFQEIEPNSDVIEVKFTS